MTATREEEVKAALLPDAPEPRAAKEAPWLQKYIRVLVFIDLGVVLFAGVVALLLRFGTTQATLRGGISYPLVAVSLPVLWIGVLALSRCYESRFLGTGTEEYQRVFNASIRLTALVALIAYSAKLDVARGFVAIALPLGGVLLLLGRWFARQWLHARRREGRCSHRVLVLGSYDDALELADRLQREPSAGLSVVGACVPGGHARVGGQIPVFGTLSTVHDAVVASGSAQVAGLWALREGIPERLARLDRIHAEAEQYFESILNRRLDKPDLDPTQQQRIVSGGLDVAWARPNVAHQAIAS